MTMPNVWYYADVQGNSVGPFTSQLREDRSANQKMAAVSEAGGPLFATFFGSTEYKYIYSISSNAEISYLTLTELAANAFLGGLLFALLWGVREIFRYIFWG